MLQYIIRIGDALSQLANVIFLFGDNANESISGRSWRLRHKGWGFAVEGINALFFFQKNHCQMSYYKDLQRAIKTTQHAGYKTVLPDGSIR